MELTIEQALQRGIAAHKEGNLQVAERVYREILQSQPEHPDANHNLGVLVISINKAHAALPFFKTALKANPKVDRFWLSYIDALIKDKQISYAQTIIEKAKSRGMILKNIDAIEEQLIPASEVSSSALARKKKKGKKEKLKGINPSPGQLACLLEHYKSGRFADAEELSVLITQKFSEHPLGWKVLGAVLKQTGRLIESLTAMQKSAELAPRDAEAHSNLGVTLQELGRLAEAEASYTQAIALKPDYAEAYNNLGNTLREQGRLGEAEASHMQAIGLKPDYVDAYYNLGITLKVLRRLDEAVANFTRAIALKPRFAEAHHNLGASLLESGKLEDAEASFKQAITLKFDYAEAHNNLGIALKEMGRLDEAETSYTQAIALKPDYTEAHNNLGITLRGLGRFDKATASYTQAIALNADYFEAHYNLGNVLQEQGSLYEAEASYTQAIALKPGYPEARYNLGITLQELGKLLEAETTYKRAIALKPGYGDAHYNLATTLQVLGRLDEAEVNYTRAVALKPDFDEAYYNLGNTLKELGRLDEAEARYKQTIALKPENIDAHNRLLMSLFLQDKKAAFIDELDYLINQDNASAIIGSLTCRSAFKYGLNRPNLFCTKPLDYVLHYDLNARYDFEKIFVEKAKSILDENKIVERRQALLVNGHQTSGNIFDIRSDDTNKIENIIRAEIENYRAKFKESEEGLIRKMPAEYTLYGWLISMKSGGNLKPHIHTEGWLSGSIYINIPRKLKIDSGNLVVALGEDADTTDTRINEKQTIDVVTGSIVLFPASLMHHTIPFKSDEERIVLAFDVIKND